MVVQAVVQEDVDAVGLSILTGAHHTLFPKAVKLLDAPGAGDMPSSAAASSRRPTSPSLKDQGVAAVFTPGAPLESIGNWLAETLDAREEALEA